MSRFTDAYVAWREASNLADDAHLCKCRKKSGPLCDACEYATRHYMACYDALAAARRVLEVLHRLGHSSQLV